MMLFSLGWTHCSYARATAGDAAFGERETLGGTSRPILEQQEHLFREAPNV